MSAQLNSPWNQSRRHINANPQNIIRDSTGARVGVRNRDGSVNPISSHLGWSMGQPKQTRADNVLAAKIDHTFDQKRQAFNSRSQDSSMDENGNINPKSAATPESQRVPDGAPPAARESAPAKPLFQGNAMNPNTIRDMGRGISDSNSGVVERKPNEVTYQAGRDPKVAAALGGDTGVGVIKTAPDGSKTLTSNTGPGSSIKGSGNDSIPGDGRLRAEIAAIKDRQAQGNFDPNAAMVPKGSYAPPLPNATSPIAGAGATPGRFDNKTTAPGSPTSIASQSAPTPGQPRPPSAPPAAAPAATPTATIASAPASAPAADPLKKKNPQLPESA